MSDQGASIAMATPGSCVFLPSRPIANGRTGWRARCCGRSRQAFALLSSQRSRVSHWLSLASEVEIAETLSQVNVAACRDSCHCNKWQIDDDSLGASAGSTRSKFLSREGPRRHGQDDRTQ